MLPASWCCCRDPLNQAFIKRLFVKPDQRIFSDRLSNVSFLILQITSHLLHNLNIFKFNLKCACTWSSQAWLMIGRCPFATDNLTSPSGSVDLLPELTKCHYSASLPKVDMVDLAQRRYGAKASIRTNKWKGQTQHLTAWGFEFN